jgi:hypothetical protein
MEHRYTERKSLDLSVVISCPRVGLFRGQTLNLSLGGMHVRSDCVVMPLHAPVLVSFQPDPDNPRRCVQAHGMVIHQHGNAFGLMFDELDSTSTAALRTLMQGATTGIAVSA